MGANLFGLSVPVLLGLHFPAGAPLPGAEARSVMPERERVEVVRAVEEGMRSFESAERALDAERLLAHFEGGADFHMHNDGQRVTFAVLEGGVREGFAGLRSVEGGFRDLEVIVLAPDAALATATFRETATARNGQVVRQRGAASWLWRRTPAGWRIVYGHVDHHPEVSE